MVDQNPPNTSNTNTPASATLDSPFQEGNAVETTSEVYLELTHTENTVW